MVEIVEIKEIPVDSFKKLNINFGRKTITIEMNIPKDVTACLESKRSKYGGKISESMDYPTGVKYFEPVRMDIYYTLLGQLNDIEKDIHECKKI